MATLKLIIEKGPRTGETLEFNSKSSVRLGRLVRGNNLQIKDPGVSSNHLRIEFNSGSGKWVITDLDSSNGTILNSILLKPLSPSEIKDGDVIKIGEITLIRVVIVEGSDELDNRRCTRRQAGGKIGSDLNLGEEVSVRVLEGNDEEKEVELEEEEENGGRQGRGRGRWRGRGRGRGRGRTKKVVSEERNCEVNGSEGNVDEVDEKVKAECGVSTRRTRSSRKELISLDDVMPTRRTRSKKNVVEVALSKVEEENVGVDEGKKTQGGRGGRKKVVVKEEFDDIDDVGIGNEIKGNLSGMEKSEIVELKEKPCEEAVNVATLDNVVEEDKVSGDVSNVEIREQESGSSCDREQPCVESVEDIARENEMGTRMSGDLMTMEVAEQQLESSLYATENPCVELRENIAQRDKPKDKVVAHLGGSFYVNQQSCSELINKTDEQSDLKGAGNSNVLEAEVPENGGGYPCVKEKPSAEPNEETSSLNDSLVGFSHVEKGFSDGLESDFAMEDQAIVRAGDPIDESASLNEVVVGSSHVEKRFSDQMETDLPVEDQVIRASETRELHEDSDTSCDRRETVRESVPVPDIEKMTLGEWFDYLEGYLPKQIYTVTDEIIEDMRKRAKQFDEFMLQQQKGKGKFPLVT